MEYGTISNIETFNHVLSPKDIIMLELIQAAEPFTSGDVVDEVSTTIPLMERLEKAIIKAREIINVTRIL